MFIKKLIEEGAIRPNDKGEIHMGTANGWGEDTSAIFEGLVKHRAGHSRERGRSGRCYVTYEFDVVDGDDKYVVVYSVDSGD